MMANRVLLVEDDARLAAMVNDYLSEAGFRVTRAGNGALAMQQLASDAFDAVILDLMLPDADGLDLCRSLRAKSDIPVLMLTARGDPMDRVIGLELGADDYLPKPFEPRDVGQRELRKCFASVDWKSIKARMKCVSMDNANLLQVINFLC
jgi:two-component system, OmpR family, phosphate regulon response regulator OmpR